MFEISNQLWEIKFVCSELGILHNSPIFYRCLKSNCVLLMIYDCLSNECNYFFQYKLRFGLSPASYFCLKSLLSIRRNFLKIFARLSYWDYISAVVLPESKSIGTWYWEPQIFLKNLSIFTYTSSLSGIFEHIFYFLFSLYLYVVQQYLQKKYREVRCTLNSLLTVNISYYVFFLTSLF